MRFTRKINSIDDEAIKYFKDFDPVLLSKTTIRHLVTHSHGLEETNGGIIFREFEPGQGWAYRDINVRMMTRLIYQLYNKSFPELLKSVCLNLLISRNRMENTAR